MNDNEFLRAWLPTLRQYLNELMPIMVESDEDDPVQREVSCMVTDIDFHVAQLEALLGP